MGDVRLDALSDSDLQSIFHVSSRTVSNWRKHGAPKHCDYLLGLLAGTNKDYPGLRLSAGQLLTGNGYAIDPNELSHIPWLYQQLQRSLSLQQVYRERCEALEKLAESSNDVPSFSQGLEDIRKKFG